MIILTIWLLEATLNCFRRLFMLAHPSNRRIAEAYLERSQIFKMELFPRIVNGRKPLPLSAKKLYLNPFSTNFTKWSNTLK